MVRAPSFPHLVEGSLGSSLEAFLDAAEAFFSNLAAVQWGALALGLMLILFHQLCRSRAWFNTLRAAYPQQRFEWRRIAGAQLVGVGINSITPARAGDVAKIYLARHSIPNSSYPTVTSSFFVDSVFDMPVGLLVLLYAITQGAVPSLDVLPSLPAFDLSFWADHPRFALFTITAVVDRIAGPLRGALDSGRRVLGTRSPGSRDPDGLQALPTSGGELDGRRMGAAVRRVLVLPGRVQHRWVRAERAVHDGSAGGLHADAVHSRRSRGPAGPDGLRVP